MVYRSKGAHTYKLRVVAPSGRVATLSTGCRVQEDAEDVEAVVQRWQGAKGKRYARADVLELVVAKRVTLAEAVAAHHDGTLDALVQRLEAEAQDVDLHPLVAEWQVAKAKSKKGAASADTYRTQLRVLYPADEPFTLARFRRAEVKRRLEALDVEPPTRDRYKAAASSFAQFLVDRDHLELNFVRAIPSFGQATERVVYHEREDAKRVIAALAQPFAAIDALACGFGMEWVAIERLTVADCQLDAEPPRVRARGTKRAWRDRWVPLVPQNRWVLPYIRPALVGKLPHVRVFDRTEKQALMAHYAAQDAVKLQGVGSDEYSPHTLHDWRHTHAVQLLRDGYEEQIAAAHLGHKNTDLVRKRYGRYKPTMSDYAKAAQQSLSTKLATSEDR